MGVPDPACTCVAPFRREPLKSLRLHRPTFGSLLTGRKMLTRRGLLRNGALIASGSLCAPWASSLPQTAGGDDQQTWTIGNDLVKRVLAFRPTQGAPSQVGLFTQQLSDLSMDANFVLQGKAHTGSAAEFSFLSNGRACTGGSGDFTLVGAGESAIPNGKSLAVRLRHKDLTLEVTAIYRVYNGHAALRKHLVLRNTGTTALHISHLAIESIGVSLGHADELTLLTQYGAVPREIFYTGRSEDACLLLANGLTGRGIAIINETPGYMKRTEIGGWDDPEFTRIAVMYDTDLMPFERTLAPGEEFVTACASLLPFRRGDGFKDPQWRLPAYGAQVLERRVDRAGPPWIFNTWE